MSDGNRIWPKIVFYPSRLVVPIVVPRSLTKVGICGLLLQRYFNLQSMKMMVAVAASPIAFNILVTYFIDNDVLI